MSSNSSKKYISPIAIDMGAKNTGCYFAHYKRGSSLSQIEKKGKVFNIKENNYTLLMKERTSKRHQRRGIQRRKLAKRLIALILEKYFEMNISKEDEQAIGFLLNRRGFNRLEQDFSEEKLDEFPKELKKELHEKLRDVENISVYLQELADENDITSIKEILEDMDKKIKPIKRDLVYYRYIKKIKSKAKEKQENKEELKEVKNEKNKLSKINQWIIQRMIKDENIKLTNIKLDKKVINFLDYLNDEKNRKNIKQLSELPDYSEKIKELEAKKWNFNRNEFKSPEDGEFDHNIHLHHLGYAFSKVYDGLTSGSRHRKIFFKEIKESLEKPSNHKYLKNFIKLVNSNSGLSIEKLYKIICHTSNFELKPLRKYFNDKSFKVKNGGDQLYTDKLQEIFEKWILKLWRVTDVSGKEKQKNYKILKDLLEKNQDKNIIDFWLECNPLLTIPPYQSKNNRNPPKCQSLIFNVEFLNKNYPEWKKWVKNLEEKQSSFLVNYREILSELRSGKKKKNGEKKEYKKYFQLNEKKSTKFELLNKDNLDARVLQILLDRVRDKDPFNLNRIYAKAKKVKQIHKSGSNQEDIKNQKSQLESLIKKSELRDHFKKENLNIGKFCENEGFSKSSFFHLVYFYYKNRKRAKDGRIFIQPFYKKKGNSYLKTNKMDYNNHLLKYCHLKPRQKRHQSLSDLAHIFQVSPHYLEGIIGSKKDDKIVEWLKDIPGLPQLCRDSIKAQKKYKGYLKTKIDDIIKNKNEKDELFKLNKSVQAISKKLGKKLFRDSKDLEEKIKKFQSPFSFAQIAQIAFIERTGFSKTCKICSYDNALRMEIQDSGKDSSVRAQRLPAITTRVIDGAVRRLSDIFANAIAKEKWQDIEKSLKDGHEVIVPLILEQNQFQFEPDLKVLKSLKTKGEELTEDKIFLDKEERIKKANKDKRCPYPQGDSNIIDGEIDHIIPRSSKHGVLNDEANLIYSSKKGNKEKGKKEFTLKQLKPDYKESIFDDKTDEEIEQWIKETIDGENDKFSFGHYLNFVNLTPEQQIAFRHALFLNKGDLLREKVINAISNRNRSFVNGTQRYFADIIANKLYLIARSKNLERNLKFDYFGLDSQSNTHGAGIYDIRREYEELNHQDFVKNKKPKRTQKTKKQTSYSHLIDAQIAFMLATERHKNNGSMGLNIQDNLLVFPKKEEVSNEKTFFDKIKIDDHNVFLHSLERKITNSKDYKLKKYSHRAIWDENPGAWHFLKLIEIKEEKEKSIYLKGFLKLPLLHNLLKKNDWETAIKEEQKYFKFEKDLEIINLFKNSKFKTKRKTILDQKKIEKNKFSIFIYSLDKDKIAQFLLEECNTKIIFEDWSIEAQKMYKKFQNLWYFTKRKNLITGDSNNLKSFILDMDKDLKSITCTHFINPSLEYAWKNLRKEWNKYSKNNINKDEVDVFKIFLKEHFESHVNNPHQKVRKVFSLPIKSLGQGFYLIKRGNWNKKGRPFTYQCQSVKQGGIGSSYVPYVNKKTGDIDFKLADFLRNKGIVMLTGYDKLKKYLSGKDDLKWEKKDSIWYNIRIPDSEKQKYLKYGVKEIQYKLNKDTPQVKVVFNRDQKREFNNNKEYVEFLKKILSDLELLKFASDQKIFKLKKDEPNTIVESYKEQSIVEYKKNSYPKGCMKGSVKVE